MRDIVIGMSAKRQFGNKFSWREESFYGIIAFGSFYLNGTKIAAGKNDERIRKRIKLSHFYKLTDGHGEIDIAMDCGNGIMKMVVVGMMEEDKEVYIEGLNNGATGDVEWMPHIAIGHTQQTLRICTIPAMYYGVPMDIDWSLSV